MRFITIKAIAVLSTVALFLAHNSSAACLMFIVGEPKMPESLYIKD